MACFWLRTRWHIRLPATTKSAVPSTNGLCQPSLAHLTLTDQPQRVVTRLELAIDDDVALAVTEETILCRVTV